MRTTCKLCAAHAKAYNLLEQSERLGMNALEATLEPYMEHLRDLEAECYREVMEGILRKQEQEKGAKAQVFQKRYGQALRLSMAARALALGAEDEAVLPRCFQGLTESAGCRAASKGRGPYPVVDPFSFDLRFDDG